MLKKVFLYFLLVPTIYNDCLAQPAKEAWVDSVFNALSVDERIGQLFMIAIPPRISEASLSKIESQIKSKEIGSVVFDSLGPVQQANFTRRLQEISDLPLLIAQDAPIGLGQFRDSTVRLPETYIIGASRSDSTAYMVGKEMARKMKLLGAHMNISAFADIGNSYHDSLSQHAFGQDKDRVAAKAVAFMRGIQDNGALAVAKNFEIQGATITGIQDDLPQFQASIDSTRNYALLHLIGNKVAGTMPRASRFPLFYQDKDLVRKNNYDAHAISLFFSGNWMKRNSGYSGLVMVDLHSVQEDEKKKGDDALLAFQTGNELIISSDDIGPAVRKIKRLVRREQQYENLLASSVRKVLAAKYDAGLWKKPFVTTDNLLAKLNSPEAILVAQKAFASAVTVVQDKKQLLPVATLENRRFLYVNTVAQPVGDFHQYLSKYVHTGEYTMQANTAVESFGDSLRGPHTIIFAIVPETPEAVLQKVTAFAQRYGRTHDVIVCDFGNDIFIQSELPEATVITSYLPVAETIRAVPQIIYGALKADARLPYTRSTDALVGVGLATGGLQRLSYSIPEDAGMDSRTLEKINLIVDEAILNQATPGCQVLVARNGKVIYDRSFGKLTYEGADSVTWENIYDLASLTKVSATLQAVMFMYEKGLIDLNKKLSYYLPDLKQTNKRDITLVDMLTHQAGLAPFIPMWNQTVKNNIFLPQYYSRVQSERYPLQVSRDLYAAPVIRDSVWSWIGESKLQTKPPRTPYGYLYSDLGFLLMQRLAEKIFNQPLDEFLSQNLYEPLGSYTTGFTPLRRFPVQQIAPTEDDKIYRKTHIAGTVHDERAAMMGGVAGHAGLFSNATDLAKLGQMWLQGGSYGGYEYYKPETLALFGEKQFDHSRRGLGWDKPAQSQWNSPTALKASPKTFGHTGFTGTCIWVDPEFDLVYIFLSNRVYPDRSGKLITSNIRSRIQDVVYESIFEYCKYNNVRSNTSL